jgi:hypothetical protein
MPDEWLGVRRMFSASGMRVRDMTLDSLNYASDSTFAGTHFSAPTVAYSLVRSNALLVVERYRANVPAC